MGSAQLSGRSDEGIPTRESVSGTSPPGTTTWRPDAMTLLFIGGFLLGFGLLVLGLMVFVAPEVFPLIGSMCLPTMIIPGIVLLAWGVIAWRAERRLEDFASWLRPTAARRWIRSHNGSERAGTRWSCS